MNLDPVLFLAEYQVRLKRSQNRKRFNEDEPAAGQPRRRFFARTVRSLPRTFEVRRPYLEPLVKPAPSPAPPPAEHTPRAA